MIVRVISQMSWLISGDTRLFPKDRTPYGLMDYEKRFGYISLNLELHNRNFLFIDSNHSGGESQC